MFLKNGFVSCFICLVYDDTERIYSPNDVSKIDVLIRANISDFGIFFICLCMCLYTDAAYDNLN